jgi:hypothetical protein
MIEQQYEDFLDRKDVEPAYGLHKDQFGLQKLLCRRVGPSPSGRRHQTLRKRF